MYNTFVFKGIASEIYNLQIMHFNDFEINSGLTREIIKGDTTSMRRRANHYGAKYADTLSIKFSLVKIDETPFLDEEIRLVQKWLTSSDVPEKLHLNTESTLYTNFYGIFTDISYQVASEIIGINVVFTCDSPFSYSEPTCSEYPIKGHKTIRYNNSSDDYGYYSPTITIKFTNNNAVEIKNISDSANHLSIKGSIGDIISLDSQNCVALKNNKLAPFDELGWDSDYLNNYWGQDLYWLRLIPGMNEIEITGDCIFNITCEFPRKVGYFG